MKHYDTMVNQNGERWLFGSGYLDVDGNMVTRTKTSHPYSYDSFVQWRGGENSEANDGCYSDRMLQWDYAKFNRCCREVWNNEGQNFGGRQPKDIERFLRLYMDAPKLKLIVILECCNQSSGYPLWYFSYNKSAL